MLTDKKRLAYVDFLKATAIILVVFGNMLPSGCWPRTLIYAFHVPLFGFVGGLLFTAPAVWGDVGKKSFNVVKRLLIPYAIFFFVCCIFYMLPDASVPTWINASAPQGAKDLIYRFLFLEKKTVWNATLSFMPCYITVSLAFIIYSKLTRGSRIGAILLATLSFGALILMESRGITVNALGVKDVFGFRNYLLMLGFYSVGYSVRPFFDILDGAPRGFERTATALASLCAFVFVAILCLKANAASDSSSPLRFCFTSRLPSFRWLFPNSEQLGFFRTARFSLCLCICSFFWTRPLPT